MAGQRPRKRHPLISPQYWPKFLLFSLGPILGTGSKDCFTVSGLWFPGLWTRPKIKTVKRRLRPGHHSRPHGRGTRFLELICGCSRHWLGPSARATPRLLGQPMTEHPPRRKPGLGFFHIPHFLYPLLDQPLKVIPDPIDDRKFQE